MTCNAAGLTCPPLWWRTLFSASLTELMRSWKDQSNGPFPQRSPWPSLRFWATSLQWIELQRGRVKLRSSKAHRTMCFVSVFYSSVSLYLSRLQRFLSFLCSSSIVIPLGSHRPADRKAVKKDSWVRVAVAVVLLGIVIGCMLLQQNGWWSDPDRIQSDHNMKVEEDSDHEDGHHHHNPAGHSHGHPSLYHHGVVLTSSGFYVFIFIMDTGLGMWIDF